MRACVFFRALMKKALQIRNDTTSSAHLQVGEMLSSARVDTRSAAESISSSSGVPPGVRGGPPLSYGPAGTADPREV